MKKSKILYLKYILPLLAAFIAAGILIWPTVKNYIASRQPRIIPLEQVVDKALPNTAAQPRFMGRDAKDQPYVITAIKGVELSDTKIQLELPRMELKLNTGGLVTLSARQGFYDKAARKLQLIDEVVLKHSDGYTLSTSLAWLDQNTNLAWSDMPVQGTGPTGNITANGFILKDNGHRVVFKGDSRLFLKTE